MTNLFLIPQVQWFILVIIGYGIDFSILTLILNKNSPNAIYIILLGPVLASILSSYAFIKAVYGIQGNIFIKVVTHIGLIIGQSICLLLIINIGLFNNNVHALGKIIIIGILLIVPIYGIIRKNNLMPETMKYVLRRKYVLTIAIILLVISFIIYNIYLIRKAEWECSLYYRSLSNMQHLCDNLNEYYSLYGTYPDNMMELRKVEHEFTYQHLFDMYRKRIIIKFSKDRKSFILISYGADYKPDRKDYTNIKQPDAEWTFGSDIVIRSDNCSCDVNNPSDLNSREKEAK